MKSIIEELRNERNKEDPVLDKLVNHAYIQCVNIIKIKNKNNITKMMYKVQSIYIGYPLYPIQRIAVKLNSLLKEQGFKTIYKSPDTIYINW